MQNNQPVNLLNQHIEPAMQPTRYNHQKTHKQMNN